MLHIIQNDPEVPPGNLLEHLSLPYRIYHPYRGEQLPHSGEIQALLVLGGAMGANDDQKFPFLPDLKKLIKTVVTAGTPYLGICLGGQLLAAALGAKVVSNRWEELGNLPVALTDAGKVDRLFSGIEAGFTTFQWHHDSFDIPAGGVLLASSTACPHQAFRVGSCAWGLQFHPEVTEQIIRDWCQWNEATAARMEGLLAEFAAKAATYNSIARQLLQNFLKSAALVQQPH
ncbi:MAG: type 1 glutamine amidotransferase [Geobacter sp.]|nr:type 1 glutamine amidotransferase [Geobacter sp.]